jgi:c-di-GMP-related signal transduction protein
MMLLERGVPLIELLRDSEPTILYFSFANIAHFVLLISSNKIVSPRTKQRKLLIYSILNGSACIVSVVLTELTLQNEFQINR